MNYGGSQLLWPGLIVLIHLFLLLKRATLVCVIVLAGLQQLVVRAESIKFHELHILLSVLLVGGDEILN